MPTVALVVVVDMVVGVAVGVNAGERQSKRLRGLAAAGGWAGGGYCLFEDLTLE